MFKKLIFVMLSLLWTMNSVHGQSDTFARLRIMQLSYLPPSNSSVEVHLDEAVIFEEIWFPFATDYIEVTAGDHVLRTSLVDQPDASASRALRLEAGHSYSVIVHGDYSQEVTQVVVDESDLRADVNGSTATIVNLSGQTISNVMVENRLVVPEIASNGYGSLALPPKETTVSGMIGDSAYSETVTPHANTDFLIAVLLTTTGEPQIIYHRSSRLTISDYLRSIHEGAQFERVAEILGQTDILDSLADDSSYTLFLPVNAVFDEPGMIPEAGQLSELFAGHVSGQNLPPYLLTQHPVLATLAGNTVSLNFGTTDSGYWEIEGTPILWDVRLANGVIYGIDGLISSVP